MLLEEKVGQMLQMSYHLVVEGGVMTDPVDSMEVSEEERKLIGSIPGKMKTEDTKKVQDEYMENHPHHIPLLFMGDVINGMETIFHIPLAQGHSKTNISLPENQLKMMREISKVNKNIVTLVFSGRPVLLQEILEFSKAVMMVWMPGTPVLGQSDLGNGSLEILSGDKRCGIFS